MYSMYWIFVYLLYSLPILIVIGLAILFIRDLIKFKKFRELSVYSLLFVISFGFAWVKFSRLIHYQELEYSFAYRMKQESIPACKQYGSLSTDEYFTTYSVRLGDSLASISKTYFGTFEYVDQIILFNKNRYTSLGHDPFIEPGWQLKIPHHPFGKIKCDLSKRGEQVIDIKDGEHWVSTGPSFRASGPLYYPRDKKVDLDPPLKIGDCVYIVSDPCSNYFSSRTLEVTRQ